MSTWWISPELLSCVPRQNPGFGGAPRCATRMGALPFVNCKPRSPSAILLYSIATEFVVLSKRRRDDVMDLLNWVRDLGVAQEQECRKRFTSRLVARLGTSHSCSGPQLPRWVSDGGVFLESSHELTWMRHPRGRLFKNWAAEFDG